MKFGVMFSCQHRMLADVVRLARPDAEVVDFDVAQLDHGTVRQAVADVLQGCDHVLAIHTVEEFGPVASAALAARVPLTLLPSFSFAGFHPDTIYIATSQGFLCGPTQHYHSRIAAGGYLTGRTPRQTAVLYNALVFGRARYFDTFAFERAMAVDVFAQFDISIDPLFDRWLPRGCFMHSLNHPRNWAFADIGLAMCRRAGLIGADVTIDPDAVSDDLSHHASHPLLPPLARRLGLAGGTSFKPGRAAGNQPLSLERFLECEYEAFALASPEELLAAPGVAAMVAILA